MYGRKNAFPPIFARAKHSRSEKAILLAIAEMYIQGVSTRKVTEVLQALCGLRVSSSQVSRAVAELDRLFLIKGFDDFLRKAVQSHICPYVVVNPHGRKPRGHPETTLTSGDVF
jgi:hypothetical protein